MIFIQKLFFASSLLALVSCGTKKAAVQQAPPKGKEIADERIRLRFDQAYLNGEREKAQETEISRPRRVFVHVIDGKKLNKERDYGDEPTHQEIQAVQQKTYDQCVVLYVQIRPKRVIGYFKPRINELVGQSRAAQVT